MAALRCWEITKLPPPLLRYVLAVEIAYVALGALGALRCTVRPADLVTCLTFLTLASVAVLAAHSFAVPGRQDDYVRRSLLAQWTIPVALLLPPVYAAAVSLPLCCVACGRGHGGRGGAPQTWFACVFDAAVLGVAGFLASSMHLVLVPTGAPYRLDSLVGSTGRVCALFAATTVYIAVYHLLLVGVRRYGSPRSDGVGVMISRESLAADAIGMCSAIVVAASWAAHPLLVVAAAPPALLLQRSLLHPHLLHAARNDAKTGLANPAWWREVAEAEVVRTRRAGQPLAVLLLDIDYFKSVNDRYGHITGDLVLATVAAALRAATRPHQLVGRFGGEEFVVLLAEVDIDGAAHVAERLRRQVAATRCRLDGHPPLSVTISVGVAAAAGPDIDLTFLLEQADAALYRAKADGRNRIRLAGPTGPVI